VPVEIHFTDEQQLQTSDETNIVEVARELSSDVAGIRFAEIKAQGQTRIFVNPAAVAYLRVVENQDVPLAEFA
jgi:hypothetical protein